jgi:hypothetical protein
VVDDDRGNLDGLTESHVITLETAMNKGGIRSLATRDLGTIDFLVEHPLDTIELVGEVGEVLPQRVESERHGVGMVLAKNRKADDIIQFFLHSYMDKVKP